MHARARARTHQQRAKGGRGNEHNVMRVVGRRYESIVAQKVGVAERVRVRQRDTNTDRHTDTDTH